MASTTENVVCASSTALGRDVDTGAADDFGDIWLPGRRFLRSGAMMLWLLMAFSFVGRVLRGCAVVSVRDAADFVARQQKGRFHVYEPTGPVSRAPRLVVLTL